MDAAEKIREKQIKGDVFEHMTKTDTIETIAKRNHLKSRVVKKYTEKGSSNSLNRNQNPQ